MLILWILSPTIVSVKIGTSYTKPSDYRTISRGWDPVDRCFVSTSKKHVTRLAKNCLISSPISVSNLILVSGPGSPSFHNDGYSIDIQHASINVYSPGRLSDFGGTLSDMNLCIELQL